MKQIPTGGATIKEVIEKYCETEEERDFWRRIDKRLRKWSTKVVQEMKKANGGVIPTLEIRQEP